MGCTMYMDDGMLGKEHILTEERRTKENKNKTYLLPLLVETGFTLILACVTGDVETSGEHVTSVCDACP